MPIASTPTMSVATAPQHPAARIAIVRRKRLAIGGDTGLTGAPPIGGGAQGAAAIGTAQTGAAARGHPMVRIVGNLVSPLSLYMACKSFRPNLELNAWRDIDVRLRSAAIR